MLSYAQTDNKGNESSSLDDEPEDEN